MAIDDEVAFPEPLDAIDECRQAAREDTHMADPTRYPDSKPHITPRWVKVFGIIAIVVVLLVVAMLLFGGGDHGPSRHTPGGPPAEQIEQAASGRDEPGGHRPLPGIPDHAQP